MGRSILVGDVHGCRRELEALLERTAFGAADRLVLVGDLVARGPDSHGVLALARRLGALVVIGNHEERLLAARDARRNGQRGPRLSAAHARAFEELDDEDWAMLEALPLHVELRSHGIRVVHAGVVPGVPFDEQDPWLLTHMRTIDDKGQPSERPGKVAWGSIYKGPPHVVFGHNAQQRPQIHRSATGLDTGCVYGYRLTALVLEDGAEPPRVRDRMDALVSVRAASTYYDIGCELRAG